MKYKILILLLCSFAACDDFGELNIDPKRPANADANFLFANACKSYADWMADADERQHVGRLAAQYFSQTLRTDESRYDWASQAVSKHIWENVYGALNDLNEARRLVEEQSVLVAIQRNQKACITTLEVLMYQTLVDLFGNIPYSEALDATNTTPAYDDATTIYNNLLSRLDNAIEDFDIEHEAFSNADPIYAGDIAAWVKFAHSIKLRLGIRLTDVNPIAAQSIVEEAAPYAFTANADNALFHYIDDNPLAKTISIPESPRFVLSNTLVDYMNLLNDPRRAYYMTLNPSNNSVYRGGDYGQIAPLQYSRYSQVHPQLLRPDFPIAFMTYAEIAFILSEAKERRWNVGETTAENRYNDAITASITQWGGTLGEVITYLKNNAVAYGKAQEGNKLHTIALQKWIALYHDGYQGWIEWRRFDHPQLNIAEEMDAGAIPLRHAYPMNEQLINTENYQAAASTIGGDLLMTRVFWDVR